jgi:hypothetical protein
MEVKVYKQKVKHLLYEQENHLAELKAESMVSDECFSNKTIYGINKVYYYKKWIVGLQYEPISSASEVFCHVDPFCCVILFHHAAQTKYYM